MGKRRDRKQMIQREKERVPVFFRAIHLRGNCSHSICRSRLCGKGYLYLEVPPQSRVRLDRGSLPSETLISGSSEVDQSMDIAEGTLLKVIYSSAHRSNVPLQVFSGETTPSLGIDLQL